MVRGFAMLAALTYCLSEAPALAEPQFSAPATNDVTLPSAPEAWLNSPLLTHEVLLGKAAVFYFFEEGCPGCRAKWPSLVDTAAALADQPVLFVAVNSGNPAAEVRKYVSSVKLDWPVIIDEDRSLEKSLLGREISLRNITQIAVRFRDGSWAIGDWRDPSGSAEVALPETKWRIDPAGIPASLKLAWRQVEYGNYPPAAIAIATACDSKIAEEAAGAKRLREFVEAEIDKRLAAAQAAAESGEKWSAFKQYQAIDSNFKGYAPTAAATAAMKPLTSDEQVSKELAAAKQWKAILSGPKPTSANAFKMAVAQVERFVKSNPETEAARAAQAALDRLPTKN